MAKKLNTLVRAINGNPVTPPQTGGAGKYKVIKGGKEVYLDEKEFNDFKNSPEFQEKIAKSRGMAIDQKISEEGLRSTGSVINKANTQGYLKQDSEAAKANLEKQRKLKEEELNQKRASVGKSAAKVTY